MKNIVLKSVILGMTASAILFTGCNKPAERQSVIDKSIAANLMELKELGEITSATKMVYSSTGKVDISAYAKTLKQAKLEGKVEAIIKLVKTPATKDVIDAQLATGVIAIVVLDDQIKILKVTSETSSNFDTQVTSLTYLGKLKALSIASEATQQAILVSELEMLKYKSPAELGESFGLVEVTAIKVAKHGNLDNVRTDYGEKKSILNVVERPFDVSTHIVVGEEIGSAAEEAATKAAAETAAKASK